MRYPVHLTGILIIGILVLFQPHSCLPLNHPNKPYLLAYGKLFLIDIDNFSISQKGSFHITAPDADLSPDGNFWGRITNKSLGAINPSTGEHVASIDLPYRPYYQIIASNGKAYVTHNVLTPNGFPLSVIDTKSKKVVKQIHTIHGLRTDLALGGSYVYLAALGVNKTDYLYLYRINTDTDTAEEIYRVPKTNYRWELAVYNELLFICYISGKKKLSPPYIEVMDLNSGKVTENITFDNSTGITRIIEKPDISEGRAFIPCLLKDGTYGIAKMNPENGNIDEILPVRGQIDKIVYVADDILVYSDSLIKAGAKGMSLFFYDLGERKEIKSINVLEVLNNSK